MNECFPSVPILLNDVDELSEISLDINFKLSETYISDF